MLYCFYLYSQLTGFNPLHKYRCCRVLNGDVACLPYYSQVSAAGKMECKFMLDGALSVSDKFEGYIESCLGSSTNKKPLTYACVEPVVKAVKIVKKNVQIRFTKPSLKSSNAACDKFRFVNKYVERIFVVFLVFLCQVSLLFEFSESLDYKLVFNEVIADQQEAS